MSKYNVKRTEKGIYAGEDATVEAADVRILGGDLIFTKEPVLMTTGADGARELPPSGIIRAFAIGRWGEMELIEEKENVSS